MRYELIIGAKKYVSNKFLLIRLASKATRKFHKPNSRIEDTVNDVFHRFSCAEPLACAPDTGDVRRFLVLSEAHSFYEDL